MYRLYISGEYFSLWKRIYSKRGDYWRVEKANFIFNTSRQKELTLVSKKTYESRNASHKCIIRKSISSIILEYPEIAMH